MNISKLPTPETDKLEYEQECNFDVSWEDHSRRLERQRDHLRKTLKMVLDSARPHPMEDGQMYHAWEEARKALSENTKATGLHFKAERQAGECLNERFQIDRCPECQLPIPFHTASCKLYNV